MNGLTRVVISVLFLGACAIAMRLTLVKTEVLEVQPQKHSATLAIKQAKAVQLHIESGHFMSQLGIQDGQDSLISGLYNASRADQLTLTKDNKNGMLNANLIFGKLVNTSFMTTAPNKPSTGNISLPKNIPLSIEVFASELQETFFQFDFKNLQIQKFNFDSLNTASLISLIAPAAIKNAEINVKNSKGKTNALITPQTQGKFVFFNEAGNLVLALSKNPSMKILIIGNANTKTDLLERIQFMAGYSPSDFQYINPKDLNVTFFKKQKWLLYNAKVKNPKVDILVDLGETGTLTFYSTEGK